VVVHSTTKYVGGHSDVIGGFVATNNDDLAAKLKFHQYAIGAVPGPLDCYLLLEAEDPRGPHGPPLRERARGRDFPFEPRRGGEVYYPGLTDHPGTRWRSSR